MILISDVAPLRESGSTGLEKITVANVWTPSYGTVDVAGPQDHDRRHGLIPKAWRAVVRPFVVAVLTPFAEVYERPRRSVFTGTGQVIVIGEYAPEAESVFAVRPRRHTLWLPSVPLLPRRRPFIFPWEPSDLVE